MWQSRTPILTNLIQSRTVHLHSGWCISSVRASVQRASHPCYRCRVSVCVGGCAIEDASLRYAEGSSASQVPILDASTALEFSATADCPDSPDGTDFSAATHKSVLLHTLSLSHCLVSSHLCLRIIRALIPILYLN